MICVIRFPRMSAKRAVIIQNLVTRLRAERIDQELSMTEVAARCGIDRTMVMRVEERERTPSIDTLLRIADALGVDLWKLLRDATKETQT